MEKLRYVPETGKFVPVSLPAKGYCAIDMHFVETQLDEMAEIIPLLNYSEAGSDFELWIPLALYSHKGCRIPETVVNRVLQHIAMIFGGANVVKSVQGLWLNQEGGEHMLYDEENHNITILLQGMNGETLQEVSRILADKLGHIFDQLSVLVVARPVVSSFYDTKTFDVGVESTK